MDAPFFTQFLVISQGMTVVFLALFILALLAIYALQRRGVPFGSLVMWGTALGALIGIIIQIVSGFPDKPMEITYIKESTLWFSLVGGGFIDLIRMLVIPIVFVSIIHVILTMNQKTDLKKLVTSTAGVALVMVAIAGLVGMLLGIAFHLGEGHSVLAGDGSIRKIQPVVQTLRHLIPSNPIQSMAQTNVIAVVVFAVCIGAIARMIKSSGTDELGATTKLFKEAYVIVQWLADFIIGLMPYGVVGLLATTLAQRGVQAILDMGLFVILLYVGVVIMLIVQALLLVMMGLNPWTYFKKAKAALLLAFTSRSSMGVLPLTVETLTNKLGVQATTANTVASFGTTAGMQGCAGVFPALCIVYVANVSGMPIDLTTIIMSLIVISLGSLGIAGVPGTATMAASVSLTGMGMGSVFASISPILAIDPLIDMGRTMLNVSGSMTNAIVVDKMMKTFDETTFKS